MSAPFYLVIACLAAVSYGSPTPRIIDGERAKIGEFPYIVSIRVARSHFCGGSIISPRYILSAAHCLQNFIDNPFDLSVHAGTNFLNETGDTYGIEKVIVHSNYSRATITNDIGLLRLEEDIRFKSTVKPIALAATNVAKAGDPCTLCGWGYINNNHQQPNDLQKLNSRVFSQTECDKIWKPAGGVPDTQICSFTRRDQGMCGGDSGSPLVSKGVQIGISSYTNRRCGSGIPDVYTRVSSYKDWIVKHSKL